jgi:hypothetical protein
MTSSVPKRRLRAADIVSLSLNPSALTGIFFIMLAATFEPPGRRRVSMAAIAFLFATLVPLATLFLLQARGRLSDIEMRLRTERALVYLWCVASYAVGAVLLFALRSAWPLWGFMALHVPNTLLLVALNRRWKISIHATVLVGLWTAALLFYGQRAVPAGALIPLAMWGRWAAGAHTIPELIGGAALGGTVTMAGITALRNLVGA